MSNIEVVRIQEEIIIERAVLAARAANWVRLVGIFGIVIVAFFFLITFVFNFPGGAKMIVWLSVGHFLLDPLAIFVVPVGGCIAVILLGFFLGQTGADTAELIMRVWSITAGSFLDERSIGELFLIFINLLLIIVDVGLLITTARYIFILQDVSEVPEVIVATPSTENKTDAALESGEPLSQQQQTGKRAGTSNNSIRSRHRQTLDALRVRDE